MANIPVEKTGSGTPWWLWLLGLLLLAALIWLIASLFGDDEQVATVEETDAIEAVAPTPGPAGPIESDLSNLYVTRVTGDRTFYVSPSEANQSDETLVVLDQNMSPGAPGIEGQVDINPGQIIDLSNGTRTDVDGFDYQSMDFGDDDQAEFDGLASGSSFILVDGGDVSIREADMQNVEVGD